MKLDLLYALEILSQVQKKHPEAIIAGGFLRDLYFSKEFKDIDIFVNELPDDKYDYPISEISVSFFPKTSCNMQYSTDDQIREVQYFNWFPIEPNGLWQFESRFEINIIEVANSDLVARVQEHDFDFCQVWTDGKEIHGVEILQQVKQTKEVTMVQCENSKQLERSLRRWERFQEKYPGFSLKYKEGIYRE
jgi:hypothetical protein